MYILRHFQVYLKATCPYVDPGPLLDVAGTTSTTNRPPTGPVVKELRPRLLSWRKTVHRQTEVAQLFLTFF